MTLRYVYSGAGGAATGADWANAFLTLEASFTAGAAGDTHYLAHNHAQTTAGAVTLTPKGTAANPDKVLCVNTAGSVPPVSADLTTGATITTTGANALVIGSGNTQAYWYGITFQSGSGAVSTTLSTAGTFQKFEACSLQKLGTSAASAAITLGNCELINTTVTFGSTADSIRNGANVRWRNTASAIAGATLPTTLFIPNAGGTTILDGVDLSALGSGKALTATALVAYSTVLLNCRLGASVTVATTPTGATRTYTDVIGSDSGSGNYRQERYGYTGTLTAETTIVPATDQASDGTTPITWKVVTTANVSLISPFETFPYVEWIDTTGGAITRTFEIVNDGTTLTTAELWAEVQYLGSASYPIASGVTTGVADILAAGSNLPTSSVTWTTTGLGSPVKQYIAVTFTPQMKGDYRTTFKCARASKTLYINPSPNEL